MINSLLCGSVAGREGGGRINSLLVIYLYLLNTKICLKKLGREDKEKGEEREWRGGLIVYYSSSFLCLLTQLRDAAAAGGVLQRAWHYEPHGAARLHLPLHRDQQLPAQHRLPQAH